LTEKNYFSDLVKIDVGEHIEKKGKFNYLSWAWAVKTLREYDPTATWEVKRFDGMPYMKTDCGYFVEVGVTVQGMELTQIHPVLNNQNKPVPNPNAFDINTAIQRCLVKAIALHGLGLYIYAGEDLPPSDPAPITSDQIGVIKTKVLEFASLRNGTPDDVYKALKVSDLTKLTKEHGEQVIAKVNGWIEKAVEENQKQGA
jgi:Protein of unknown function (DUF1071)